MIRTREEALELFQTTDTDVLLQKADSIRQKYCGNTFHFCSIINAKSGKCSENCAFCAQSGHYSTHCQMYNLLDDDIIIGRAKECERDQSLSPYSMAP